MKTFGQLTPIQRADAALHAKRTLISHLMEGVIEIHIMDHRIQKDFERIVSDMRKNETPTKAWDLLTAHPDINRELNKISWAAAEGSRYDDNGRSLK